MAWIYLQHDRFTSLGAAIAKAALLLIGFAYCFEVVARYFFNSPTSWANESVSYFLCAMIFLMMPQLAKDKGHVAVTIILDSVSPRKQVYFRVLVALTSFVFCLIAAWFMLDETIRQFEKEIMVMAVNPIPKWWVSMVLPYGLLGAAFYFLRQFLDEFGAQQSPT